MTAIRWSPPKATQVWLARAIASGDRRERRFSDQENLHRIGGEPSWVHDPHYTVCPECGTTMSFFMQIDSDLLPERDEGWFWGAGGLFYVTWCDRCKISAYQ